MTENYIQPFGKLSIGSVKLNYNICFHQDGQEIGKLGFNGPAMIFIGNAEESAKVFIDWLAHSFENRLEEERKTEREECAKLCEELYKPYGTGPADAIRARGNK